MYPYRVFISYSHDDAELAQQLRDHLENLGALPMFDLTVDVGYPFTEEIRRQISYAHVFIVLLTANSKDRPWVHQEIGYAMGLRVPILPLALDELPQGMAEGIQALKVRPGLEDLSSLLTASRLEKVVFNAQRAASAMFECADMLHERTRILVDNATAVYELYGPAKIRQLMAFSSFSIPDRHIKHDDWDKREGSHLHSPEVRELLLKERQIMEKHARQAGCDLILDPYVTVGAAGKGREAEDSPPSSPAKKRLQILVDFLESMPDDKVRAVFQRGKIDSGIHIVGDWFTAEAVVPHYKTGYKQTIFTRHAPTVQARVNAFDAEFEDLQRDIRLNGTSSRQAAIHALQGIIHS